MRKGEEQWRKRHARARGRTEGPEGNCVARIERTWNCCCPVVFLCLLTSLSVDCKVWLTTAVCRVRAPMSSFLPTYDRQRATCPCRILSTRLKVPPSVRQVPDAMSFRERRVTMLVPRKTIVNRCRWITTG